MNISDSSSKYPDCKLTRKQPDLVVNKEIADAIGQNFDTLPIFEKGLFDYTYKRHYSMERNEFLKCRWNTYKRTIEQRVFAPFQFLDIRDYHFYNCRNRLLPIESIKNRPDFKLKLKVGPGVDFRGQMPIPQEHLMKRGEQKTPSKPKRLSKTQDTEKIAGNTK